MAAKGSNKQHHPVRTLVVLFLVVFLIYGSIGFGVIQEHWDDITAQLSSHDTEQAADTTSDSTDENKSDDQSSDNAEATPTDDSADKPADDTTKSDDATATDDTKKDDASTDENKSEEAKTENKPDAVSFIPKFALDLAGGTQIILSPVLDNGAQIDDNALDQAIDVIRQRIDASGVAEAEINKQGTSNIVVGIPGATPSDDTIKLISNAAKMRFRPVIVQASPSVGYYSAVLGTESALQTEQPPEGFDQNDETQVKALMDSVNQKDKEKFQTKIAADTATGTSKYSVVTDEAIEAFDKLDCSKEENRKGGGGDDPEKPLAACSQDGSAKYMLSPVSVEGEGIDRAQAGLKQLQNGKTSNEWVVSLQFKDQADDDFIKISEQIKTLEAPRNQFAIVLDSLVISAPSIQKDTTFVKGNGVEISSGQGSTTSQAETRKWAQTLANQLSFGALPMSFNVDSKEQVSASLGSEQLQKGLFAGIFGLLLVVIYSVFQYRALGLVTVGSLGIAAFLTYGVILLLSWQMGYRLSLPGIIGFIVSIGITADSFIVYFERIRDELRDGRSLEMSITRGWKRAIRTILASDTVNVLAAVILYVLAVGGVRGFAFTLGLTTFIDLIVVLMFTHPVVILLSKLHFFKNGHPASGLSAFNLGAEGAKRYKALSGKEKRALKEQRLAEIATQKEQKELQRGQAKLAKDQLKQQKADAKIHQREYEALMEKKSQALKEGVEVEEIADISLTIAERKALAAGKDISKLKSLVEAPVEDDKRLDKKKVDDKKKVKTAEKNPVKASKKAPAKTTAAKSDAKAKPVVKKAPVKTATKVAAAKPAVKTTAKTTASKAKPAVKATASKTATSKAASSSTKTAAKPKAPAKKAPAKKPVAKTAAKATTKVPAKKTATEKKG